MALPEYTSEKQYYIFSAMKYLDKSPVELIVIEQSEYTMFLMSVQILV